MLQCSSQIDHVVKLWHGCILTGCAKRPGQAIHGQQADLGLARDTTPVDDTPETATFHLRLEAGPAIKVMDFSMMAHPALRRGMRAAAEQAGLTVQDELLAGIGTDAG